MTKDLVQLNNDNVPVTTSKQVADYFGKRHDNVLRAIENIKDKEPEFADLNFEDHEIITKNAHGLDARQKWCEMTKEGFTAVAMGFTGSKALRFRISYIEAFAEMEQKLREQKADEPMTIEEMTLKVLTDLNEKVQAQKEQIEDMKPKAEHYDKHLETKSLYNLTDLAKSLEMTAAQMGKLLRQDDWLFQTTKRLIPTAKAVRLGFMRTKEVPTKNGFYVEDMRLTPLGMTYFQEIYSQE